MATIKNVLTQDWWEARIQTGTGNFISSKTVNITFPINFTTIPRVLITPVNDPLVRYWAENITTSGFTLQLQSNQTISFDWMAIQRD